MSRQANCLIAKSCGWMLREDDGLWSAVRVRHGGTETLNWKCGVSEEHAKAVCLPRYFYDLNACHDAESFLSVTEMISYILEITRILNANGGDVLTFRAPASIRATALAKIFGDRKENQ